MYVPSTEEIQNACRYLFRHRKNTHKGALSVTKFEHSLQLSNCRSLESFYQKSTTENLNLITIDDVKVVIFDVNS